jgi:S1-C subfamily serine protease
MYRIACLCCLAVLGCLLAGPVRGEKKSAQKDLLALQEAMQSIVEEVEPSIACVLVSRSPRYEEFGEAPSADTPGLLGEFDYTRVPFSDPRTMGKSEKRVLAEKLDLSNSSNIPESFGSGIVVDDKACLILTNYHVVRGATKVFVRFKGGKGSYANILAADPRSDLAVLDLINKLSLKAIKLGDGGKARKAQMVLSIANPFAAGVRDGSPSASWGIISNIRQRAGGPVNEEDRTKTLHQYGTLLQTDVRINLGCSGGALVDLNGELIGITSSLAGITGKDVPGGFAIPFTPSMRRIVEVLKKGQEVNYGFLGVGFNPGPAKTRGVVLSQVTLGSPARVAGLKKDDTVLEINGNPVEDVDDLFLALGTMLAGDQVPLVLSRPTRGGGEERVRTQAVLAKFAVVGKIIARNRPSFRGLRVDYTSLMVQQPLHHVFQPQAVPLGVMVCEVKPKSPAATTPLKFGDVITRVNNRRVATPEQFYQEVNRLQGRVTLTVGNNTEVTIN